MQETRVQSLSQEDPLEKEMATHSSVLAWEIPWTEAPDGLQYEGSQRVWWLSNFLFTSSINFLRQKPLAWNRRHLYIVFASHIQIIRKYCWLYCPNILRIRQLISTFIGNTWSKQHYLLSDLEVASFVFQDYNSDYITSQNVSNSFPTIIQKGN